MYIVVDKKTDQILWENKAPLKQDLADIEVWYKYDDSVHRIIKMSSMPVRPYKVDGDILRTMTLQEQAENNIITIPEGYLIDNDKVRIMNDEEMLSAGLISQETYDNILWQAVRFKRNNLLLQCDWTQLDDVTNIDKTKWQIYRQKLRDVPQDNNDPTKIIWPEMPS